MLFDNPFLTMAAIAIVVGIAAWRLRLSAWWILLPGLAATGVAVLLYSPVASCNAEYSVSTAFGGAIVVAIGLHLGTALAALVEGIQFVRDGAYWRAARRLLLLLLGAALGVATFALALFALLGCLS